MAYNVLWIRRSLSDWDRGREKERQKRRRRRRRRIDAIFTAVVECVQSVIEGDSIRRWTWNE